MAAEMENMLRRKPLVGPDGKAQVRLHKPVSVRSDIIYWEGECGLFAFCLGGILAELTENLKIFYSLLNGPM